ncbi:MAG: hypothetical protein U9Q97_00210 [Acidobacteriota bacterium]|nr:hypothetical protein [Acidobacteriota bacterium]
MSIACQEAQDALPGAHTIVDKSIQIESGNSSYIDLRKGEYTVRISSDDAVTVEWIGDNLTGYNTDSPTKSYNVNVQASDSTTLKIHNPSGWFSNPTAIVHVKIVDED